MKKILVTGSLGFIGYHISESLLKKGFKVVGIDNFSGFYQELDYHHRLKILNKYRQFLLHKISICEEEKINLIVKKYRFDFCIHCAAKTGIIHSLREPLLYYQTNTEGSAVLLDALRRYNPKTKSILLSSSSVYGIQKQIPLNEKLIPRPISPYGDSKYLMELLAKKYSDIYNLPIIIVRPFSIYGPGGRRDMAPYLLLQAAKNKIPFIQYGNDQNNKRDWTYIDDFVWGIVSIITKHSFKSYEIYNLGNDRPLGIDSFIATASRLIYGYFNRNITILKRRRRKFEMSITHASIDKAKKEFGYCPITQFDEGYEKTLKFDREQCKRK